MFDLIVEDGSGLPDADAYVSVAEVDAYFEKLGTPEAWECSANIEEARQKDQAIRRATIAVDALFGHRFDGERATVTQALVWPRVRVEYRFRDRVPSEIKSATAELALRVRQGTDLMPDQTEATISERRVTVGPITTSTRYSGEGQSNSRRSFDAVEALLRPLLRQPGVLERG